MSDSMSNSIAIVLYADQLPNSPELRWYVFIGVDVQQTLNQKDVSATANNFQIIGVYTVGGALV